MEINSKLKPVSEIKPAAGENIEIDIKILSGMIKELKLLLQGNDFLSGRKIDDILELSGLGPLTDSLNRIDREIKKFNYGEALRRIEKFEKENNL